MTSQYTVYIKCVVLPALIEEADQVSKVVLSLRSSQRSHCKTVHMYIDISGWSRLWKSWIVFFSF